MTPEQLAAIIMRVRDAGGAPPASYWPLTELMLQPGWIGHPDPQLRDDLIYSTLAGWITAGVYSDDQLLHLLQVALDDQHLFYGIGSHSDDTVLTRAFSVLLIPPLLAVHRRRSVLPPSEVRALAAPLERYLAGERDFRGYDVNLGWLHAVAHAADAFGSLMQAPEFDSPDVLRLLDSLRAATANQHHVYAHGEDERLAMAMTTGLRRSDLSGEQRAAWLEGFRPLVHACGDMGMPDGYARLVNVSHTLRALYFLIRREAKPLGPALATRIDVLLLEFSEL